MTGMDKRSLSERDICTKFITPALRSAGWDEMLQIREELGFTRGRIIVRGKMVSRGQRKRADYILSHKPNVPIAVIEAKDAKHSVGDGIQQALGYAEALRIPFAFSSNGDGFVFHDRTGASTPRKTTLSLDAFPSPADLWARYRSWKGFDDEAERLVLQDYYDEGSGKAKIKVRRALLYYALKRLGPDTDPAARNPQDQQIVLLNRGELFNGANSSFVGSAKV